MYYNLFLDDIRFPKDVTWVELPLVKWTIVRNYKEFVYTIKINGLPNFVSFDHDLSSMHYTDVFNGSKLNYSAYTEKTGYECAKFLVEYCITNNLKFPNYTIHSMNPIGKQNIISYVESYKKSLI